MHSLPRPPLASGSLSQMLNTATRALKRNDLVVAYQALVTILKAHPNDPQACYLMGMVMIQSGRLGEAYRFLKRAQKQAPKKVQVLNGLASVLQMQDKLDEALKVYTRAIKLKPDYGSAYNNCAVIHKKKGRFQEAEACYKKAVQCSADFGDALNNLGFVQQEQGKISQACESFRLAHESGQCRANAYSNYLMALNYDSQLSPEQLHDAHERWGQSLHVFSAQNLPTRRAKPKRIAYISGDFRAHSVAYFIEPVLTGHDRRQYEVYCYYNNVKVDEVTQRLKGKADHWLDCTSLSDVELAQRIRADEIDILVDLSGHTGKNRLAMMNRRVAPMQVSWLGYPAPTGLPQVDFRISDGVADPELTSIPEGTVTQRNENLIRLPGAFLCYQNVVGVASQRASKQGITFASFNNFSKVNDRVIESWAKLLNELPDAKLLVKNSQFQCAKTKASFVRRFQQHGIASKRLECMSFVASQEAHLALYQRVDIALDTFPYNGTTTTFEALWMGIPVVTFCGDRHAGRVGASILTELGLAELVGASVNDYVSIAVALAHDPGRLAGLHSTLRQRLQDSSLCDGAGFTRKLEAALEEAWRTLDACD